MGPDTFTGADILRGLDVERRPVFWDENAGGWCWRLPGRLPVRAESWAAAWAAVVTHAERTDQPAPAASTPPPAPSLFRRLGRWFLA
jgi:hypothetical protein